MIFYVLNLNEHFRFETAINGAQSTCRFYIVHLFLFNFEYVPASTKLVGLLYITESILFGLHRL